MGLQKGTAVWCVLVFVVLCFSSFIVSGEMNFCSDTVEGTVVINGKDPIAETDENFICATVDLWPPEKCDYGDCSWGNSSLLNLDLSNVVLFNAIKAFSPLRLRLGGTLQDRLIYQTEREEPCHPFVYNTSQLFNYTLGCLSLRRWDELNSFIRRSRAIFTFGLNALNGKTIEEGSTDFGPANASLLAKGPWDSRNAESIIRYTVEKGYNVYAWTLGNELGGIAIYLFVNADPYAHDTFALRRLIREIYGVTTQPIMAPGALFERDWFEEYLKLSEGSLNIISQHIYNLGAGSDPNLLNKILDPTVLDTGAVPLRNLQNLIKESGTSAVAWVSESGGAYNSGRDGVTNTFVFSFWYLDILGMAAAHDTKVFCRQTLVGGYYGLLDTTTFVPNPDYYGALLWHRLMGKRVLRTTFVGSKEVRAYAHCAKQSEGIVVLLINLGKTTVKAKVSTILGKEESEEMISLSKPNDGVGIVCLSREEYHLTPLYDNLQSKTVLLNGKPLILDFHGAIPALEPARVSAFQGHIVVSPHSVVFVHMPYVYVPACTNLGVEEL